MAVLDTPAERLRVAVALASEAADEGLDVESFMERHRGTQTSFGELVFAADVFYLKDFAKCAISLGKKLLQ